MLETIKTKMGDEQVQRAVLHTAGVVVTLIATQVFSGMMYKGIDTGIETLMAKLHPTNETPAG